MRLFGLREGKPVWGRARNSKFAWGNRNFMNALSEYILKGKGGNNMNELYKYGFVEVGEWKLDKSTKAGIRFELKREEYKDKRVVYCFVADNEVKYIGICEAKDTGLLDRMKKYEKLQGNGTNKYIAELIFELLKSCNKHVKVYALEPLKECFYKDIGVDMVRGLEYPLIEKFNPLWNRRRG